MKKLFTLLTILTIGIATFGQILNPTNGTTDISIKPIISITFNPGDIITLNLQKNIHIQKITDDYNEIALFTGRDGSIVPPPPVAAISPDNRIIISDHIISFDLSLGVDKLENTKQYTIHIDDDAILVNGIPWNGLNASQWGTYTFTTESAAIPPSITTYNPTQDDIDVPLNQPLVLTFNEGIVKGTSGFLSIYNSDDTEFISYGTSNANVVASGTTLTITHIDFAQGSQYYVLLDDGFIESSSTGTPFGGIASTTEWAFTSEILSPTISTYSPLDNTTGLSIDTDLSLSFNEDITIGSAGTLYIKLTSNNSIYDSYLTTDPEISVAGNTLNITPLDFTSSTEYYVTIDAGFVKSTSTNLDFEGISSTTEWSFTTDAYKTWSGGTSDFNTSSNWSGSGSSIIIPRAATPQPIVSSSTSINHAIIEAGASLTITSTGDLTIDESLRLKSSIDPAIGNANLLNEGILTTTGATVNIQQLVGGETIGQKESVYVSSPVDGATMQNANIAHSLYLRSATTASWEKLILTNEMIAGTGYLAYGNTGDIINFSGNINNSDIGPIITYRTTSPINYGWNLIGNPFPCSIDWKYMSDNGFLVNMDEEFYILNDDTETYGVYNSAGVIPLYVNLNENNPGHIPSCHSFWVQVKEGQTTGSITIPTDARVNTHYSYLKNTTALHSQQIRFAGINANGIKDELLISFSEEGNDDIDLLDSEKRFSNNSSILQLYSIHTTGQKLVIDSYNNYSEGKEIHLGYTVGEAGTYKIAVSQLTNITDGDIIKIEDTENNTAQILSLNDEYSFTTQAGTFESRFIIYILSGISTDINNDTNNSNIKIYSVNNYIYIDLPVLENPFVKLFTSSGKLIHSGELQSGTTNHIQTIHEGIMVVKITSKNENYTQKLLIRK